MSYLPRAVDTELDELLKQLPALALQGIKGVGKTATAVRRAGTTYRLDDTAVRAVADSDLDRLLHAESPVLLDEWQYLPETWDKVRRAVDDDPSPGRFLLTGSATPAGLRTHTGAGRIVSMRMRPMTLIERGVGSSVVSLGEIVAGNRPPLAGSTAMRIDDYAQEIVSSGLPGLREYSARILRRQLDGYLDRIAERDLEEAGHPVRRPAVLRQWMAAYAAATSTTASYEKIRAAASADREHQPARTTVQPYRDALERLWILDPVPPWLPTNNHLSRVAAPPKHQLADPALAARLLGVGVEALLEARPVGSELFRDGPLLGRLFESLVTLCVRVHAQTAEADVKHLRTRGGDHEVDLIVERPDRRVVAIEVKMGRTVTDDDVRHLHWLRDRIGAELIDSLVITSGQDAYRRQDGIGVVPAAMLGP